MIRLTFLNLFRLPLNARREQAVSRRRTRLELEALEDRQLLSTISGFVYNDLNNDGIFQPGEPPLANNPIALKNSQGTVIATTTTDATGHYVFTVDNTIDTTPKTQSYTASFPLTAANWTLSRTIPQFNPALGTLTSVQISSAGQLTTDYKVESLDSAPSTINVAVNGSMTLAGPSVSLTAALNYQDSFAAAVYDGTLDFGGTSGHDFGPHSGNNSKQVILTSSSDLAPFVGTGTVSYSASAQAASSSNSSANLATVVQTSGNGSVQITYTYTPSNQLQPGSYTIVETAQPPGYLPGLLASNSQVIPGSVGQTTIPVVLTNNDSSGNNFAKLLPADVSGFVYLDNNGNGVKDAGDTGIGTVTITLTGTSYTGSAVTLTQTTTSGGSYDFSAIAPGTYTLTETPPTGYYPGAVNPGSLGGTAGTGQIGNVTVPQGSTSINNNFGHLPPGTLSGNVYVDANLDGKLTSGESGVANDPIILTGIVNGQLVIKQTTTNATGGYSFTGLAPGTYVLTQAPPAGYFPGATTAGSLGGSTTSGQVTNIVLAAGSSGANYNFGELQPSNLSGYVYLDNNTNGVFDPQDTGLPGVSVILNGTTYLGAAYNATMATDSSGHYTFANLLPGTYAITQIDPPGITDAVTNIGSLGGVASGLKIQQIAVGQNASGTNYNFGKTLAPVPELAGGLSGTVYVDTFGNGQLTAGDPGVPGDKIILTGVVNGQLVIKEMATDAHGNYSFINLEAGTYVLTQAPPLGYFPGATTAGSLGGTAISGQILNIFVPDGAPLGTQYNFGEVKPSTLSGHVYLDNNQDGVLDSGDNGLAGITVILGGSDFLGHAVHVVTTTDATGHYSFANLMPGTYTIAQIDPPGIIDFKTTMGSLGGFASGDMFWVNLGQGVDGINYDFGKIVPPGQTQPSKNNLLGSTF